MPKLVWCIQLEVLRVPRGARDVKIRDVHRAHTRVQLAVEPERLSQVQDLHRSGYTPLPSDIRAHNVAGPRRNELSDPGRAAIRRLCRRDGDVECRGEGYVLVDELVVEWLLEPVEIELLKLTAYLDRLG